MSKYEVTEDVPIPAGSNYKGKKELYPWSKLTVEGMSFFVPDGQIVRIRNAAAKATWRSGVRYRVQREPDGVRVFRLPESK